MKHLIIFLIIIVGIMIIKFLNTDYNQNKKNNQSKKIDNQNELDEYVIPKVKIASSSVGGRGAFAEVDYKAGEIVEICPTVLTEDDLLNGQIRDYIFKYDDTSVLVALGFCSIYNHSDNPNLEYEMPNEKQMIMKATRDIKKGEELFVSYGKTWWDERKELTKNL